jgi:hypothetical protein
VLGSKDFMVDLGRGGSAGLKDVDYGKARHVLDYKLVLLAHTHIRIGEHELAFDHFHLTPLPLHGKYQLVHVVSINLKLLNFMSEPIRVCYSCNKWLGILFTKL